MSENIICEPSTVFGKDGVLYLTENQPCVIPINFELTIYDAQAEQEEPYTIQPTDVVKFVIKSDIKLISNTLVKSYTGVVNNTVILRFTAQDMAKFLGGKTYFMSALLYNDSGTLIKTLIKVLRIFIQPVV